MSTMYSQLVFPQAGSGGFSYGPVVPAGCTSWANVAPSTATPNNALVSPTWNPLSATDADRTQWWVDTAGTLTLADAQLACYGVSGLQAKQVPIIMQGFDNAVKSVPVSIGGTTYNVDNSPGRQAQNITLYATSSSILSKATAWAANTAMVAASAGLYCNVNGTILFSLAGGTTGATAPTPPTTPGATVLDNTITWELMMRQLYLSDGTSIYVTPQDIVSAFEQGELYLHTTNSKLSSLLLQNANATTVSTISAVVW